MESEACGETHFSTGPTATVFFLHREIWLLVIVIAEGPQPSSFLDSERRLFLAGSRRQEPRDGNIGGNAGKLNRPIRRLDPVTGFFNRGDRTDGSHAGLKPPHWLRHGASRP